MDAAEKTYTDSERLDWMIGTQAKIIKTGGYFFILGHAWAGKSGRSAIDLGLDSIHRIEGNDL